MEARKLLLPVHSEEYLALMRATLPGQFLHLLATPPDAIDGRSGYDLVAAKVSKVVFMDGGYNFGCAAGNIGPADECYDTAKKALGMPPNVRMVFSNRGQNPDIYTGSGVQNAHPPNSPCREALKDWCCNPNGKMGSSGRLSWDPITVMIAALDVGSVFEKEVNYGCAVSANAAGQESFASGAGTRNAQTDFTDGGSSPGKIRDAIDRYVNMVPGAPTPPPTPPTPPPPPTPAPPPANWTKAGGANCYGARGSGTSHGATDLEHPADSSCGTMTLAQCQAKCEGLAGCTAVTVQDGGGGLVECYRKGDVSLQHCDLGSEFTTYVRGGSAVVSGLNCYGPRDGNPAHGAKDMESPVSASCGVMSVPDCLAKCAAEPGCSAVNWARTSGDVGSCYRKADIVLAQCDRYAPFDLWLAGKA